MATNPIKGEALIIYVHDSTDYVPIACLTSNSLAQTMSIIETQTKCDPGVVIKGSGTLSSTISFEGLYIDTTSAGAEILKASHDKLKPMIEAGALMNWQMDTGLADTPYYYGEGIFSDLELAAPTGDEFATFSGSLAVSGSIVEDDPITP